jgi:flagellar P-ring protein FlgI
MGFGLVIGLKNTGDTIQTEFTKRALTNLLSRVGIVPGEKDFKSKNVAAVMVTAKLPAFMGNGQKIDVTVSSLGDATSLNGGTLLMTPLQGPDDVVYAVAQGPLESGFNDPNGSMVDKRQTNVARILNGAIVEKEVPVSLSADYVSIMLDKPDYTTASRVAASLNIAGIPARARDAATITASREGDKEMVDFIAVIENLTVVPDSAAKIVINEQNGVIVMGEFVSISPVAISYGDITVTVSEQKSSSGTSFATLSKLVESLNAIGVKPKDLIAIIQAIKSAGAISADVEVI